MFCPSMGNNSKNSLRPPPSTHSLISKSLLNSICCMEFFKSAMTGFGSTAMLLQVLKGWQCVGCCLPGN